MNIITALQGLNALRVLLGKKRKQGKDVKAVEEAVDVLTEFTKAVEPEEQTDEKSSGTEALADVFRKNEFLKNLPLSDSTEIYVVVKIK